MRNQAFLVSSELNFLWAEYLNQEWISRIISLKKTWRVTQAELRVLVENLLIYASVVFQHEGIVGVGNEQDIEYPSGHKIHETSILQYERIVFHLCIPFVCAAKIQQ